MQLPSRNKLQIGLGRRRIYLHPAWLRRWAYILPMSPMPMMPTEMSFILCLDMENRPKVQLGVRIVDKCEATMYTRQALRSELSRNMAQATSLLSTLEL